MQGSSRSCAPSGSSWLPCSSLVLKDSSIPRYASYNRDAVQEAKKKRWSTFS
ncbi:hypothetical protein BS78_06G248800 [Paspalum vaginatum]|nr:hypothetical protein BS78_06G248800 [Paspalum vaginatum]